MKDAILQLHPLDEIVLPALFATRTHNEGACLIWTGWKDSKGYGRVVVHVGDVSRRTGAHRAAWMLAHGPITDADLVIDHLCRNHSCVRVEHLDLTTNRENTIRGYQQRNGDRADVSGYVRTRALKETCRRDHPLSGENVRYYLDPRTGYLSRICRECRRTYRLQH